MKSVEWSKDLGKAVKEMKTGSESVNKLANLSKAELNGIQRTMQSSNRSSVDVASTWL